MELLDSLTNKQKKIVISVGIIIALIVMFIIYQKSGSKNIIDYDEEFLISENSIKNNSTKVNNTEDLKELEEIVVHIAGAVNSPGVVKLKDGERIEDAIKLAGGLTENADISNVNLAYVLEDGVKIIIPSKGDGQKETLKIIDKEAGDNIVFKEESTSNNKATLININKANIEELQTLSGVGPSLASRIIEYRNTNGKFSNIEDLKNVSGIGDNKFEAIKKSVCVD